MKSGQEEARQLKVPCYTLRTKEEIIVDMTAILGQGRDQRRC